MMKQANRILLALLALCLLLPGGLISAVAAEEVFEETNVWVHTFDEAPVATAFNNDVTGFGSSYAEANAWVVEGKDAISGRSPRMQKGDMYWWGGFYYGRSLGFELDVRFEENYRDTTLLFAPQIRNGQAIGDHGMIDIKPDENGNPVLYNYDGTKLATLPRNQTCRLTMEANCDGNTYSVKLNGELIAEGNNYTEQMMFYAVYGLVLKVRSTSENSYILLDNVRVYTVARAHPQPHSFQAPGNLPTVTLPEVPTVDGVAVYANDAMISKPASVTDNGVLLPLEETMQALGATVTVHGNGSATMATDKASFTLSADGKTLSWNDDTVTLNTPAAVQDGVLYAPGQVFAEILGAKVWYAEALEMVVVTTGSYLNDDILRAVGASFWMNGEPYYEISFNKWDLSHQIYYDPSLNGGVYVNEGWSTPETTMAGAEEALKELQEHGFKTIRIFCDFINPAKTREMETFWKAADTMFDLCDKYGIRLVLCLGLLSPEFVDGRYAEDGSWVPNGMETYYDLITDPDSNSRGHVNEFIKQYVSRYKDRDTVLMWEIVNEGNLQADIGSGNAANISLWQLGQYYTDMATEIRKYDDVHMITSGDAMMRTAQWHLFAAVMKGGGHDWRGDNVNERLKALWLLNQDLDALSIHSYGVGYDNQGGHMYYMERKGTREYAKLITWDFLLNEARTLGLPLYNGECGGMMDENGNEALLPNIGAQGAEARERYLATMVDAGVQLTHWWDFRSDHYNGADLYRWSITVDGTPESFQVVKSANEELKARYLVNPLNAENTHTLSDKEGDGATPYVEETTVPDVTETPTAEIPNEGGCASVLGGGLASIVMLGGLWLAFAARKRK